MTLLSARWAGALVLTLAPACDLTAQIAANEAATVGARAARAVESHYDPVLVGDGLPAMIVQLEGLYSVVPDNDALALQLAQAYAFYAHGWLEVEADDAEQRAAYDEAAGLRRRARLHFERARNIALHQAIRRHGGLRSALDGGVDGLARHLEAEHSSDEDARWLFWVGFPWAGAIQLAQDPVAAVDLPVVRALLERAAALAPEQEHASPLVAVASLDAALTPEMGGDRTRGRARFEQALRLTRRQFFAVHIAYAETYAVAVEDRELFRALLFEVLQGGDPDPNARLANRLARDRAIRLLRRQSEWFAPVDDPGAPTTADAVQPSLDVGP